MNDETAGCIVLVLLFALSLAIRAIQVFVLLWLVLAALSVLAPQVSCSLVGWGC